jgi:hypothetical protein
MNEQQKKIIDRVRKLLALGGDGSNANESAAAFAAAQRLMTEHAIESAMLDTSDEQPDEPVTIFDAFDDALSHDKRYVSWKGQLAMTLATGNGCHCYSSSGALHLIGRPSDVATVRYFFAYCTKEVERLTRAQERGHSRVWYNNYRQGVVDAIRLKVKAERESLLHEMRSRATGMSLVVVDNAIAKVEERAKNAAEYGMAKLRLGKGRASGGRFDGDARMRGRRDGARINLRGGKGLGAGASKKLGS